MCIANNFRKNYSGNAILFYVITFSSIRTLFCSFVWNFPERVCALPRKYPNSHIQYWGLGEKLIRHPRKGRGGGGKGGMEGYSVTCREYVASCHHLLNALAQLLRTNLVSRLSHTLWLHNYWDYSYVQFPDSSTYHGGDAWSCFFADSTPPVPRLQRAPGGGRLSQKLSLALYQQSSNTKKKLAATRVASWK